MTLPVSSFFFSFLTSTILRMVPSTVDLTFCNNTINGYYDPETNSCFQVHDCRLNYDGCVQMCAALGIPGWRGRAGIILNNDVFLRLKANLPPFDIDDKIPIGMKTTVWDSGNIADWFWYENDTAVAPAQLYTGSWDFYGDWDSGEDCAKIQPREKWIGDTSCNCGIEEHILCEFVSKLRI